MIPLLLTHFLVSANFLRILSLWGSWSVSVVVYWRLFWFSLILFVLILFNSNTYDSLCFTHNRRYILSS